MRERSAERYLGAIFLPDEAGVVDGAGPDLNDLSSLHHHRTVLVSALSGGLVQGEREGRERKSGSLCR